MVFLGFIELTLIHITYKVFLYLRGQALHGFCKLIDLNWKGMGPMKKLVTTTLSLFTMLAVGAGESYSASRDYINIMALPPFTRLQLLLPKSLVRRQHLKHPKLSQLDQAVDSNYSALESEWSNLISQFIIELSRVKSTYVPKMVLVTSLRSKLDTTESPLLVRKKVKNLINTSTSS